MSWVLAWQEDEIIDPFLFVTFCIIMFIPLFNRNMSIEKQLNLAKNASRELRIADNQQKNIFLKNLAGFLIQNTAEILIENKKDLESASQLTSAMKKRLTLTADSIKSIAQGVEDVAKLADPIGTIAKMWKQPNGMQVCKMRVPIGVIFFVFESRPNVIVDAAALAVKSGNALIARGGKEACFSNDIFQKYISQALESAGLSPYCVQQLEDKSHEAIYQVVKQSQYIDLVVARGREQLIKSVKENSFVPVIAHERGLCHLYIDETADKAMAMKIAVNAKTSNPATCNTIETLLIHKNCVGNILPDLLNELINKKVEIRGCERTCKFDKRCVPASEEDWSTEYLDLILSVKVVDSFEEALEHIEKYSSRLTDAIVTEDSARAMEFERKVNSSTVLINASNRLTDGGQFGLGAEFGISTSSIHMRGPMGLEDLTVTKYIVLGNGQIRE